VSRTGPRTEACSTADAKARLAQARKFFDASALVREIEPGGSKAGEALGRLLDMKDSATYGVHNVSRQSLKACLRAARTLLEFAESATRR
jgi:hypothetical protein